MQWCLYNVPLDNIHNFFKKTSIINMTCIDVYPASRFHWFGPWWQTKSVAWHFILFHIFAGIWPMLSKQRLPLIISNSYVSRDLLPVWGADERAFNTCHTQLDQKEAKHLLCYEFNTHSTCPQQTLRIITWSHATSLDAFYVVFSSTPAMRSLEAIDTTLYKGPCENH